MLQPPAQAHSPTSVDAARSIKADVSRLRRLVFGYIAMAGDSGRTDEEIALGLEMNPSTARPRRVECVDAGLVRHSGRKRKGRSGRSMAVWVAVEPDA